MCFLCARTQPYCVDERFNQSQFGLKDQPSDAVLLPFGTSIRPPVGNSL